MMRGERNQYIAGHVTKVNKEKVQEETKRTGESVSQFLNRILTERYTDRTQR